MLESQVLFGGKQILVILETFERPSESGSNLHNDKNPSRRSHCELDVRVKLG